MQQTSFDSRLLQASACMNLTTTAVMSSTTPSSSTSHLWYASSTNCKQTKAALKFYAVGVHKLYIATETQEIQQQNSDMSFAE